MKFLDAINLSKKNYSNNKVNVMSSFNFDFYKYFLNAKFVKRNINLKINKIYSNNLKLNLINYKEKTKLWIFLDWSDLDPNLSVRSNNYCNNISDLKLNHNFIDELINILNKLSDQVLEILVFAPHTRLINDYVSILNFKNSLNSIGLWNSFLMKFGKIKNRNIKIINEKLNSFEICTENLFRSNTPLNIDNINTFTDQLNFVYRPNLNKKLIITDLDDTLWKGTLGESGSTIVSWEKDTETFKHLYYQKMLKECYFHGKILSIASKNNISNFNKILKRKDFILKKKYWSSIQCSWDPKSEMISNILKELNLGEDSFLFIDNNKFELEEVKRNFPNASYLEFPEENLDFKSFISKFYSNFQFSENKEDKIRNNSYKSLKLIKKNKSNIDSFLKKINMKCSTSFVKDKNIARPLELINKTNQFNLNGLRITEKEWSKYFSKDYFVITLSLTDKIADHGTIGVLVCKKQNKNLNVLSMVLSCRVFSRNVEIVFLKLLMKIAKENKIEKIIFKYKKTLKNRLVKQFIEKSLIKKNTIIVDKYSFTENFIGKVKIIN